MKFPVRSIRWLVLGACLALLGGCGSDKARVLSPEHAAGTTAAGPSHVGRIHGPDLPPCVPTYPGPVLSLFGPGLEYTYPTGGYCVCPEATIPIDVPANRTVTFRWSADGSLGCTEIHWYRWSLDIKDVSDQTPRIDEATDLAHWSIPSLASSATIGPFALSPTPAENERYFYVEASDRTGRRSLGILRIHVVESANQAPDVGSAIAELTAPGAPNGAFSPVRIGGVTDPDGDAVTITVTGVTQDEPLLGRGERRTCPDARIDGGAAAVRRERSGTGNGRVYTIAFVATDGNGGESRGTADVCIPHDRSRRGCVRDPRVVNSLESCGRIVASRTIP